MSKARPKPQAKSELLTRKEAAAYLGVAEQTLAIWKTSGRYPLPVVQVGRLIKYRRSDLDEFLSKNTATPKERQDSRRKMALRAAGIAQKVKRELERQPAEFAEVKIKEPAPQPQSPSGDRSTIEIVLRNGIILRVGADCRADQLSAFIAVVESH